MILLSFLLCLIFLYLVYLNYYEAFNELIGYTVLFLILETILVMIFIFKERETYVKKAEREYIKQQLKTLQIYADQLEDEQQKLRKFKHDYKNLLLNIKSLAKQEQSYEIMNYIVSLDGYSEKQLDSFIWKYNDLNNVKIQYLKSLLLSKFFKANVLKIPYQFECREYIEKITMNEFDFLRIIGNLLDNAIEATNLCNDKSLNVCIYTKDNQLEFVIVNTYREQTNVSQIIKPGYTTKKNHLGLGLSSIESIKKDSPNLFTQYKAQNGIFTALVSLPLD